MNARQPIRIASKKHAQAITRIYRLVQIDSSLFHAIAGLQGDQSAAIERLETLGGFISPPDEKDMELALQSGLVLIFVQHGDVKAYIRVITQADTVHQALCTELQIDPLLRKFSRDSFTDWSGVQERVSGKTLRQVHWLDRELALLALNASLAGLENRKSGRLAWSVDSAVHPESRNLGIAKAMVNRLNRDLRPGFQFRVFRIFEVHRVNDTDISIANVSSKNTFINTSARLFAYTEEEVVVDSTVRLLVRWNYWLREFSVTSPGD